MGQSQNTVTGSLTITSKGFGFVLNQNGPDVFVARDNLKTAMDGDVVQVEVFPRGRKNKPAGSVRRVVERSVRNIVGVFHKAKGGGTVSSEDDRLSVPLFVPKDALSGNSLPRPPKSNEVVVARLDEWSDPQSAPRGHITEILGHKDDPGIEMKIVARSQDLPLEFPDPVVKEAERLTTPSFRAEARRRKDLRKLTCFTIDPDSARDFDDAVSLRQLKNGRFELGVHIADVTHYVREGSPLDEEALRRGTSVYFVQDVIPMLPERLSNELCSLKPNEDRLAFSVLMELDSVGTVHRYSIEETVIRSKERFAYQDVEKIIQGGSHRYAADIHLMQLLSKTLRARREQEGSIDFDMTEQSIVMDKNGIPREISPKERLDAHRMIEEFMLLANRTVAGHIAERNAGSKRPLPFIYRVHPEPEPQDAREFLEVLETLGIPYRPGEEVTSEDYRNVLSIVSNFEFKDFVEKVALRSMTKAVYSIEDTGHFGLAFDHYTHFTSPIRRYPDLIVHRLLKAYRKIDKPDAGRLDELSAICEQSTAREVKAVEAEREYIKLKSMQFLNRRVGNTYRGIISGVAAFGLFVELKDFMIEGMVHVSTLGSERFELSDDRYALVGSSSGTTYRLGDRIAVTIKSVSVEDRKADFVLASSDRDS